MDFLAKTLGRMGLVGCLRVMASPLAGLWRNPARLAKTLWACRILAQGKWREFNGFNPYHGANGLFYWTQALNLRRFGRDGASPTLGLGEYPLSRWFHTTLISLYAFRGGSAVALLAGMGGWWLLHFIWIDSSPALWVLAVLALTGVSTAFYVQTFILQNYNVLGWLFFPLGFYGLCTGHWGLEAAGWLLASLGSSTVAVLAVGLSFAQCFADWSVLPLLACLPVLVKLASHFWPNVTLGNLSETLSLVTKSIGSTRQKARYLRLANPLGKTFWYTQVLYIAFGGALTVAGQGAHLFWTGLAVCWINKKLARFADDQSIDMLLLSLACALTLQNPSVWIFLAYVWMIFPFPGALWLANLNAAGDIPVLKPYSVAPVLDDMERFLLPVQKGQRVLMSFDDPGNQYENLFDGQRVLLEVPLYVASKNEFRYLPDWWAVFETNYEGAPDFWGRDPASATKQLREWNADYLVVYDSGRETLDPVWSRAGFTVVGEFDWRQYAEDFKPVSLPMPRWWLLKPPDENSQTSASGTKEEESRDI